MHNLLQRRMTLHCNSHDTLKSGNNIQTLSDFLRVDAPDLRDWNSNV